MGLDIVLELFWVEYIIPLFKPKIFLVHTWGQTFFEN
jgi:hypothetical protein